MGVSHITRKWNHSSVAYSSGGTMRLQRRNYEDFGGTNNGWEYATGLAHRPWSFNAEDAKPFYNVDADANGNLDILSYTDSTLFHDMWSWRPRNTGWSRTCVATCSTRLPSM